MTINYFGQSFFKISTKNEKGEDVIIAIDPFDKATGLKMPNKFSSDIVLITHEHHDHNNLDLINGTQNSPEPFVISGPGEYEKSSIMIYGIPSWHDDKNGEEHGENIMYLIGTENMWLAHLGDLGQKELTSEQLEKIEEVDLLMIPVGGTYTLDTKTASKMISQIEPRIIIPMHYKLPGLKYDIDGVDKFIKEIGLSPEEVDKYKIQKKNLPQDKQSLVIIKN